MIKKPDNNRWLISYADLVTLLLALFVVLYSTTFEEVAPGIMSGFQSQLKQTYDVERAQDEYVSSLLESIVVDLHAGFKEDLNFKLHKDWLQIDFINNNVFLPGDFKLTVYAEKILMSIAHHLSNIDLLVKVECYIDEDVNEAEQSISNWALSALRSAEAGQYLVNNNVNSNNISAVSLASDFNAMPSNTRFSVIITERNSRVQYLSKQL